MAGHLKKESINDGIRNLSARNMQQRWIAYMRRFKTTLKTVKLASESIDSDVWMDSEDEYPCDGSHDMGSGDLTFIQPAQSQLVSPSPTAPTSPAPRASSPLRKLTFFFRANFKPIRAVDGSSLVERIRSLVSEVIACDHA
ncbi:hypothetical protein L917_04062 [Phytophthora nicotianae]|uniref:Uncharacterized protein n=1 Tax=Phytophthora nicotianae TaxID=4792 RepID=W2LNJ5_PHYNI|nr:hypothetical protein L917_04062 [Phytophthora nicotianae]